MSVPNKFGFRLRPGRQRELTALQPSLKGLDLNDSAPCRAASEIPWQRGLKTCVNARACFGSLSIPVNGQCQPPLLFRIAVRGKNTRKFAKHLNSYNIPKTFPAPAQGSSTGSNGSRGIRFKSSAIVSSERRQPAQEQNP